MNKRVQRVENAACLGGISHPCNAKVSLYERLANDYLTVTLFLAVRGGILILAIKIDIILTEVARALDGEKSEDTPERTTCERER